MLWNGGQSIWSRFAAIRVDLEFFDSRFSEAKADIESLQTMMRDHLSLNQERRNFVLTVLAAIFLPLSFVTSLFGMNMTSPTQEGPVSFSTWVNNTIDGLPSDLGDQTRTLVSTISTSGTLTWSWTQFAIFAVCLTMTLPLSLTLGNLVRIIVHVAQQYRTYWRALAIPPSVVFVFLSIFGKYLPLYPFLFASWGVNGLLALFEIGKVYLAWQSKSHRSFWTSILVLTAICFLFELLGYIVIWSIVFWYFPWMLLPWVWIIFRWIQSVRTNRSQRRQDSRPQNPTNST